jgi:PAS domain S-box-containing protein
MPGSSVESLLQRLRASRATLATTAAAAACLWGAPPAVVALIVAAAIGVDVWSRQRVTTGRPSPESLYAALQHLPGVFFVIGPDMRLRQWNAGFREVSGYETGDFEGQTPARLFSKDDQSAVFRALERVLETGSARVEAELVTKDGRAIPMLFTGARVMLDGVPCVVGTGVNIEDRKRAEAELRRREKQYRLLAENVSDVVTLHDAEGRRLYVSPSSEDLIGFPAEELVGTLPYDRVHPEDRERLHDSIKMAVVGAGGARIEYRVQHADGHYVWVESHGRSTDEDQARFVAVTRDVSAKHERERTLMQSRRRLSLQKRRLRLLYDIIAQQDRPTGEQLQRVLDLGTDLLGVDVGIISWIHDGTFTIEASTAGGIYEPGRSYPLEHTYAALTLRKGGVLDVSFAGRSEIAAEPCYQRFGLEQYLGAPIYVDGDVYGTLTFASESPRSASFTEEDREFVRALVQWVCSALKSRAQERALASSQRLLEKTEEVASVGGWVYEAGADSFTYTEHLSAIFEVDDDHTFTLADGADFFSASAWWRILRRVRRAFATGEPFDLTVPAVTGRGRRRWLRLSGDAEPVSDEVHRIWGTVQDITDRREVEDELRVTARRLQALIASLHEGVLVEDRDRTVQLVNQQFCDLFSVDVSPDELVGVDCAELAAEVTPFVDEPTGFDRRLDEILGERKRIVGERVRLYDGRVMERDFVPIEIDGTYWGHLWKYRDVTESERREAELRAARDAADTARAEAERAERLKSIFLANMSHEIRTPLTSIIGFSEVLEDEVPEPYDRMAELVGMSGRRLLNTISSVLDLSKLEAGRWSLDLQTLDLRAEVTEAARLYRPRAEQRDLAVDVDLPDEPVRARVDRAALQRVLDNLVGNAIKFTPEGGRVVVRLQSNGRGARLEVEDSGPGLDPDLLDHLFEPFVQSPNERDEGASGSGLGLAITRRLVVAMDGSIDLDSDYAGGTRFVIHLPDAR